jgi:hypothetical protein
MKKHTVPNYMALLACFTFPFCPRALGQGKGPALGNSKGAKVFSSEMTKQVGQALHNASSRATGLFRRPAGWNQGKKTGWDGSNVPPGQAAKSSPRFSLLRHGPFAPRGTSPFTNNGGITVRQVANFDRFLDMNPGLQKSLSQNPSLIRNQAFLADHPSLDAWLKAHPQAAKAMIANPLEFKSLEGRFEMHEINPGEVANFDRYLDTHPNVAASLKQDPSLINNSAFLANNPSLATWMKAHPQAALEMRENPQAFRSLEGRFEMHEINPGEVANFDRYLDTHPNVAASLKQDPSLINNSAFLANNPSLATWMKAHPQAALEMRENPQAFKSLEQRFETAESQLPEVPGEL